MDAKPGMLAEAGVGVVHFAFGPRGSTGVVALPSTTNRARAGPEGESDETIQFAQIAT
jgi:hypothetical protein